MNEEAFKQRKVAWMELWKQLHQCMTADVIEQTWRFYLQPILNIPLGISVIEGLTIAHGNVAELLTVAVQTQSANDWDKLLLELASTTWKTIQDVIEMQLYG